VKTGQRFTRVKQVCVVVHDLDEAVRRYVHKFGIGPWYLFEYRNVSAVVRGEPQTFSLRIALARIDDYFQWELLQPLDDVSIYARFLADHGEGVQHVGFEVGDVPGTAAEVGTVLRSDIAGLRGGIQRYAMLDTVPDMGVLAEIMDYSAGWIRGGAVGMYPPSPDGIVPELDY
jgi:catechol 2,3-dioxygenase-like lactoylglutathione lyase family enzyme